MSPPPSDDEYETVIKVLTWAAAVIVAISSAVAFAFTTFETKADHLLSRGDLIQRVDRMENKIDWLIQRERSKE